MESNLQQRKTIINVIVQDKLVSTFTKAYDGGEAQ